MLQRIRAGLVGVARVLGDKVFWLIMAAVWLGVARLSPWFIVPLGLLLTLFSVVSDAQWYVKFKRRRLMPAFWKFWFASVAQNLLFVGAAFVVGHAIGWLWF